MDMGLKGKTAVITGCNRGIGQAVLRLFAAHGATIYACARQPTNDFETLLQTLRDHYTVSISPFYFDLGIIEQVKTVAGQILSTKEPIHVLVNNAAMIHTAIFQMTSIKKLKEVFEIDFFSQTNFTQYILKSMIKNKKGSILYISSSSALDGNEGRSAYSSAKAAIIAHAKVLSRELGVHNIRVNSIAPGLTNTDMMKENHREEIVSEMVSRISLRRIANPEEIANVVLLLSSDLTSYITGQVIRVDGGM